MAAILAIIVLFLSFSSLLGQYYKYFIGHDRYLVTFFDLDKEWNLPTWYASNSLLFCSLLLLTIALKKKKFKEKYFLHWLVLSFTFLFLAFDESVGLHENSITPLRNLFNLSGILYYAWVLPAAFLLCIFSFFYLRFFLSLPSKFKILFSISMFLYVGGTLGMELIGGYYASFYGKENMTYAIISNIEEVMEMAGVVVFIYTLLYYIAIDVKKLRLIVNKF